MTKLQHRRRLAATPFGSVPWGVIHVSILLQNGGLSMPGLIDFINDNHYHLCAALFLEK